MLYVRLYFRRNYDGNASGNDGGNDGASRNAYIFAVMLAAKNASGKHSNNNFELHHSFASTSPDFILTRMHFCFILSPFF